MRLLSTACEAFGRAPSEVTFYAYEIGLVGIPIERIEQAVFRAIRSNRFMPTVMELRTMCGEPPEDDPVAKFKRDCQRAVLQCEQRRRENPIPLPAPAAAAPLRITHDYHGRTQQDVLNELAIIHHADQEGK